VNESAGEKLWKRRAQTALGNRRSDFHFSHSFNNNKLDDRNHFLQNAKTSVASLRRLITPTRNADHDQPGTLIISIGIRNVLDAVPDFSSGLRYVLLLRQSSSDTLSNHSDESATE